MKKSFLSLFAVAALALGSCSSEDIKGPNVPDSGDEGYPVGYMGFTISTDASRAGADAENDWPTSGDKDEVFNDGSVDEYALAGHNHAHLAVFFDKDGNYFGSSYLTPYSVDDDWGHKGGFHNNNGYPEQFYTYITRWRNASVDALPTKVVVFINEMPGKLEALKAQWDDPEGSGVTLADLLKSENNNGGILNYNGNTYFTMSNSVYYDASGNLVNATDISNTQICATVEEALANRVTVYVERLLAKHTLTYGESYNYVGQGGAVLTPVDTDKQKVLAISSYDGTEDDLDWPDTDETEWGAYLTGWNMNGLNQNNEYTFKQLTKNSYWEGGYFNNPNYHRSYWGESQNYAEGVYPTQYRTYENEPYPFKEEKDYNWFAAASDPNYANYTLRYISYDEIAGMNVYTKTGAGETTLQDYPLLNGQTNHRYTLERTYDVDELDLGKYGYSPYRQATHYLIGAKLVMGDEMKSVNGVKPADVEVSTKLYAYNWYWIGEDAVNDYIRYSYHRLASSISDGYPHTIGSTAYAITDNSLVLYKGTTEADKIEVADAAEYFEVVAASMYHGDGKVVIAPKTGVTLYVKAKTDLDQETYDFVKLEDVTTLVYDNTQAARYFYEGDMYYAIPVQHMHGNSNVGNNNANRVSINKYNGYDTSLVDGDTAQGGPAYTTGQFGVVRNHWYRVNIQNINNVGIPVHEPDQPIIPDPEDEWAVAFEIVVIPWHVIDMGDVDL